MNDAWLFVDIMNQTLSKRSLPPIDVDRYRQIFDFPIEGYYRELGFDMEEESFKDLGSEFISIYIERMYEPELYPDTIGIIERLADRGIRHSILSASEHGILSKLSQYYGLSDLCVGVRGTDNFYARGKVEMARTMIEELGLLPSEVLVIGDSTHDHEVAQALGSGSVLLSHGHFTRERLEASGSVVVNNFKELESYITG